MAYSNRLYNEFEEIENSNYSFPLWKCSTEDYGKIPWESGDKIKEGIISG